jgi:hypothetical protein
VGTWLNAQSSTPEDWTFIGHGELCDDCVPAYPVGDDESVDDPGLAPNDADDAEPGTATQSRKMIAFNVQTGEEYEIELSGATMAELAAAAEDAVGWLPEDAASESEWLASDHSAPGEPNSYDPNGFSAETPTLPGWSNGVDAQAEHGHGGRSRSAPLARAPAPRDGVSRSAPIAPYGTSRPPSIVLRGRARATTLRTTGAFS